MFAVKYKQLLAFSPMARYKIELPKTFAFHTEIPVTVGLLNYANHLGNDAYLTVLHEARIRFLTSLGGSELDFQGLSMVMTDSLLLYKNQAFHSDLLSIALSIDICSKLLFDFYYQITCNEKEILRAKTGFVFIDTKTGKSQRIPKEFFSLFEP